VVAVFTPTDQSDDNHQLELITRMPRRSAAALVRDGKIGLMILRACDRGPAGPAVQLMVIDTQGALAKCRRRRRWPLIQIYMIKPIAQRGRVLERHVGDAGRLNSSLDFGGKIPLGDIYALVNASGT